MALRTFKNDYSRGAMDDPHKQVYRRSSSVTLCYPAAGYFPSRPRNACEAAEGIGRRRARLGEIAGDWTRGIEVDLLGGTNHVAQGDGMAVAVEGAATVGPHHWRVHHWRVH